MTCALEHADETFLTSFSFGIFILKALNGLIPDILGTQYGSKHKLLNPTHFQWSKTKRQSLFLQLILFSFKEECLK